MPSTDTWSWNNRRPGSPRISSDTPFLGRSGPPSTIGGSPFATRTSQALHKQHQQKTIVTPRRGGSDSEVWRTSKEAVGLVTLGYCGSGARYTYLLVRGTSSLVCSWWEARASRRFSLAAMSAKPVQSEGDLQKASRAAGSGVRCGQDGQHGHQRDSKPTSTTTRGYATATTSGACLPASAIQAQSSPCATTSRH